MMRRAVFLIAVASLAVVGLESLAVESIANLTSIHQANGSVLVSGQALDEVGNPIPYAQLGVHDALRLMSYAIDCDESGGFEFETERSVGNDVSAAAIDFLNENGELIATAIILKTIDFGMFTTFETSVYQGVVFPVYGSSVDLENSSIHSTVDLGVSHYWTNETSSAYAVSEAERLGLMERVADDMIDSFAENAPAEFFSAGDIAFYTVTFLGASAACAISHGVACVPAYAAMGKAWVVHATVDAGFGLAGAANEALVEEGVYDETTGTYVKGALVGGKLVFSVVHGAHEAAGRVGELQGLASHIGVASPSVQAGFAFHDAANLAQGCNEVLDLLALALSSDVPSPSSEAAGEMRSAVLRTLDLMWESAPKKALETALAILNAIYGSETSTIPSLVRDGVLNIADLLWRSDLGALFAAGSIVCTAADQSYMPPVREPTRCVITGVPALSQRKSNGEYLIEGVVPGCGPVAAAMLLAYYARSLGCVEFLRPIGSENHDLIAVVEELRSRMSTFTVPVINQAATLPGQFIHGLETFIDARFHLGPGVCWLRDEPANCYEKSVSLIQAGIPHVLHFDWRDADPSLPLGWHYAVVVGYRKDKGRKELIANMGWGPRWEPGGYVDDLQVIDMTDADVAPTVLVWLTSPELAATEDPKGSPVMYESVYDIDTTSLPARLSVKVNAYPPSHEVVTWRASDDSRLVLPPGVNDSILVARWYDTPAAAARNTVLVLDTSGSMDDPDRGGASKIRAAREAATTLLDIMEAENGAGANNSVAIVAFGSYATVRTQLTSDLDAAQDVIDDLDASGGTNLAKGLKLALALLDVTGEPGNIVLLSDGMPTISDTLGSVSELELQQEILAGPAAEIGAQGHCLFVVGFGLSQNADSMDEQFLNELAASGACADSYFAADEALELQQRLIESHMFSSGRTALHSDQGEIRQDETISLGSLLVQDDTEMLYVALTWPGSSLTLGLTDPIGIAVTPNYPGASISHGATSEYIQIEDPVSGSWQLSVTGVHVPSGITQYTISSSVARESDAILRPLVTLEGVAFSCLLPGGTTWAKIVLVDVDGVFASEIELSHLERRFPHEGAWCPSYGGEPLAAGQYVAYLVTQTGFVGASLPFFLTGCYSQQ